MNNLDFFAPAILKSIRIYRDYQRDKIAERIRVSNHEMYWRNVKPLGGASAFNRQYILLESAKVKFYLYIVKPNNGLSISPSDTFDTVYYQKTGGNIIVKQDGSSTRDEDVSGSNSVVQSTKDAHARFCNFVQSVLFDTLHYALTIDDLSPAAITSIVNYARYMVINLRNPSNNDQKDTDPKIFTHWKIARKDERHVHVMIVLDPDYDCAGYEGPRRFDILQQLANLIEPTNAPASPIVVGSAASPSPAAGESANDG